MAPRKNREFRRIAIFSLTVGISGLLIVSWMVVAFFFLDAAGLGERTMMVLYLSWLAVAGCRLSGFAAETNPVPL